MLDYGSIIFDPYLSRDIEKLDRVETQAARFITGDNHSRENGNFTGMLDMLELETPQHRRSICRCFFLFKVVEGLAPAINPGEYLKPQKPKRRIKPRIYEKFKSVNLVEKHS